MVSISLSALAEWLHFTRIRLRLLYGDGGVPSVAAELRATRTFFGDNTRHNRARHTSAHTNGETHIDFSGQRVVATLSLSSSFHAFVRQPVKLTSSHPFAIVVIVVFEQPNKSYSRERVETRHSRLTLYDFRWKSKEFNTPRKYLREYFIIF